MGRGYVKLQPWGKRVHHKRTHKPRTNWSPDEEIKWACGFTMCGRYWNSLKDDEIDALDGHKECVDCARLVG